MKRSLVAAGLLLLACSVFAETIITVDAGEFERRGVVAEFALPSNLRGTVFAEPVERGAGARPMPHIVQDDGAGKGSFLLPKLERGQKVQYRLRAAEAVVNPFVTAVTTDRSVLLKAASKTIFEYHTAKTDFPSNRPDLKPIFHRAAYIHPVFTPSGAEVTGDYPANHKHHHGIWMAWTHTDFEGRAPDFWNMGDGKGTVEFVALDRTWSGPVHAGFIARHRYMDLTATEPKAALNETWTVRAFAPTGPFYVFDIDIKDECATKAPVKLPEYRYGGICVRGNWAWNGKGKSFVLTSEGETDAAKGDKNQVHARWVHLGGQVDGKFAGIASFSHPSNFRSPEPVRLNPAEPYFNYTPQQAGDMEITPEKPFTARYRFVVADGKPNAAELNRLWNDYANPVKVEVSTKD